MSYITGADRRQPMLLPESLDDYVAKDHAVRFIDAFVEGLNLAKLGFERTAPAETGRAPYAPADLLKLFLWGYLNRIMSSRRLSVECERNLEVLWLLGKLQPCFKTIAAFRKANRKALKGVFREFTLFCRELDLFGRELGALDGTKLKASNHPQRSVSAEDLQQLVAEVDAQIEQCLSAMEAADEQEAPQAAAASAQGENLQEKLEKFKQRRQRQQELLEKMTAKGREEIFLSDEDCQRLPKVGAGYNAQSFVDAKHHLIAVAEIVEAGNDHGQLQPLAEKACAALGVETLKVVADGGYHDRLSILAAEEAGLETYVPRPQKGSSKSSGHFHKSAFAYDAAHDVYRCPNGATLKPDTQKEKAGNKFVLYGNYAACQQCALKSRCTKSNYRRVERWEHEAVLETVEERLKANPQMMAKRKALVEHPFGTIKFWWGQGALLCRGLEMAQAEFTLSALAYNMRRALNIVGVPALLKKLAERRKRRARTFKELWRAYRRTWSGPDRGRRSICAFPALRSEFLSAAA
jgi:transposase